MTPSTKSTKRRKTRRPKFAKWVRQYGVERLAAKLRITRGAIYFWLWGDTVPSIENTSTILQLAGGALQFKDLHPPTSKGVRA